MLRVMHRLRLSMHDAHYAGELVDGARCLALFGDVATELCVRHAGDEGLFRAYDSVEFLAPVRAGDVLEIYGEIVDVGRSSRKMRFWAHKVLELSRDPKLAVSAARLVEPPLLVCRASGTCVVPARSER
jgi:3-aminobutyryl-CoA ammonia-lyase